MRDDGSDILRDMQRTDLSACAALFVEVFNGPPWSEDWEHDAAIHRLGDCMKTPGFRGWVCERDGELSAMALGYCEPYNRQSHYFLREMCVRPSHQRQGIGRRLMEWLMRDLQAEGVDRVYLLTAREGDAEAFYRRCGFYVSPRMILMSRRFEAT